MVQHVRELTWNVSSTPELVLLVALLLPLHVVVHELGHAIAALRLTRKEVFVRIRARERRWSLRFGRLLVEAGPSGVPVRAFCLFDATVLARVDLAAIIVAGPLASLAAGLAADQLAQHSGGLLQDVASVVAATGYLLAAFNMVPYCFRRNGAFVGSDGFHTLVALLGPRRTVRSGPNAPLPDVKAGPIAARWAAEVDAATERARAGRALAHAAAMRARDAERRAGSIPPPDTR